MKIISALILGSILTLNATAAKSTAKNVVIDPAASTLTWEGKKIGGQHHGEVKLKEGSLTINKDTIVAGSFAIDMASINNKDITDSAYNAKLVGHLKSEDFFSTEKNPTANFKITKVVALKGDKNGATHKITGDLSIKGITQSISFPATVKTEENNFSALAKIALDRTKFDIKYRSKNFFKDLGDKVIDDTFTIDLKLAAKK